MTAVSAPSSPGGRDPEVRQRREVGLIALGTGFALLVPFFMFAFIAAVSCASIGDSAGPESASCRRLLPPAFPLAWPAALIGIGVLAWALVPTGARPRCVALFLGGALVALTIVWSTCYRGIIA